MRMKWLVLSLCYRFYPSVAVITHWFHKRAAYALGFVVAGAGVGGVVFPILLSKLFLRLGFGIYFSCVDV